jgi:hypothetical protein
MSSIRSSSLCLSTTLISNPGYFSASLALLMPTLHTCLQTARHIMLNRIDGAMLRHGTRSGPTQYDEPMFLAYAARPVTLLVSCSLIQGNSSPHNVCWWRSKHFRKTSMFKVQPFRTTRCASS